MFPGDFSKTVAEGYERRAKAGFVHSLLLVKDFGAEGDMKRSDSFLSNSDVPSIVCSGIGSCRDVLPDPTINGTLDRVLSLYITAHQSRFDNTNQFDIVESYEIKNNIFDSGNWKKTR